MVGTFLLVLIVSIAESYKVVNRNILYVTLWYCQLNMWRFGWDNAPDSEAKWFSKHLTLNSKCIVFGAIKPSWWMVNRQQYCNSLIQYRKAVGVHVI